MNEHLKWIEELSDEAFLRACENSVPGIPTFKGDPTLQDVVRRLAGIVGRIHYKLYGSELDDET